MSNVEAGLPMGYFGVQVDQKMIMKLLFEMIVAGTIFFGLATAAGLMRTTDLTIPFNAIDRSRPGYTIARHRPPHNLARRPVVVVPPPTGRFLIPLLHLTRERGL